jgi:hypothetical protein
MLRVIRRVGLMVGRVGNERTAAECRLESQRFETVALSVWVGSHHVHVMLRKPKIRKPKIIPTHSSRMATI